MEENLLLKQQLQQERQARKTAERILEQKTLELRSANEKLLVLNTKLEQKIKVRNAELERNEKRYRLIVESAQDFIFRTDPKGYFTYVNPVVYSKFGYSQEELIGTHFTDFVAPAYRDELMNLYISFRENFMLGSYQEFPVVAKNGNIYWIGQNVRFIVEDDEIKEVTGVARDITEWKLAEEALANMQLRMISLIKNLHAGILVEDENRKVILTNRTYCKYFNIHHNPQELIGNDCSLDAIRYKYLFSDPQDFINKRKRILNCKKPITGMQLHMTDGRILEQDYIPIKDGDRHLGHLWQYRDITQEYQSNKQLQQSEEKYRGIMENMELGLMEVDNNQKIIRVYDWFCDMTGYTEGELLGKNAQEVFIPESFVEEMTRQQANRIKGQAGVYEVQLRKKDGQLIWVLISGAPIMNASGEVTGSVGIHYEISKQKKLQHELEDARRTAEAAEKAEKQFLARMSHEIRTPLNAIIGISHLLEDTALDELQQDYVESIKSSSDILQNLISDILDLSKITAGKLEVHPRLFDLRGTIKSLEKTFQLKLKDSPVHMEANIDDRIDVPLIADELLLNQILLNLIGNAVKFTKEGRIDLSVNLYEIKDTEYWLAFTISDTGIGIRKDHLNAIFENFKQADNDIRFQFGGTGMGLTIAKKLIELQNGTISVESEPGKGTTFHIILPFQKGDKGVEGFIAEEDPSGQSKSLNIRVLVAEDNFMNRKYIGALLKKWAVDFVFANNGKEAVQIAQSEKFDIILMDISMPEMDGYDATILIRNTSNPNQQIPIIALTADALVAKRTQSKEVGMTDFLAKPFKPQQLKTILHKYNQGEQDVLEDTDTPADEKEFAFPEQLNREHLEFLYHGDLNYAGEMFNLFLDYTMVEYQKIDKLLEENKLDDLKQFIHKLKPNFSLVGLTGIEKRMDKLEQDLDKNDPINDLDQQLSGLRRDIDVYIPLIEQSLKRMKASLNKVLNV